ncbi:MULTISPECIES: hypothetical protein [unclassified Paraburkholderia]|uniref:hypothetical protein n=1 Tax=unclassified Paraburkholderia TaxID=2615204 RepID=UPI002AB2D02D|nr:MULTISPECIES: hypothetical protein [unclassified Paraburkholderia]
MTNHNGKHLITNLDIDSGAAGVFGICYSILTWSGVGKGFRPFELSSWRKTLIKVAQDGHATTFLFVKKVKVIKKIGRVKVEREEDQLTTTGISAKSWEFETKSIEKSVWARSTGNATTYVYYIGVNQAFIDKYRELEVELNSTDTTYHAFWPNLPFTQTHYQNCVSHSHYLVSKLGLANWPNTIKGWWMPSASNWMDWFKSFVPTGRDGFSWKYKKFESTNTHFPPDQAEKDQPVDQAQPVEPVPPSNADSDRNELLMASPALRRSARNRRR